MILLLGVYLPLFGASLLVVLLVEWMLLRRIESVRRWLGLRPAGASSSALGEVEAAPPLQPAAVEAEA